MISCGWGEISGSDFARRDGIVQQTVVHEDQGIGPCEGYFPGQRFTRRAFQSKADQQLAPLEASHLFTVLANTGFSR